MRRTDAAKKYKNLFSPRNGEDFEDPEDPENVEGLKDV